MPKPRKKAPGPPGEEGGVAGPSLLRQISSGERSLSSLLLFFPFFLQRNCCCPKEIRF